MRGHSQAEYIAPPLTEIIAESTTASRCAYLDNVSSRQVKVSDIYGECCAFP
jgi:hypothetical protein